MKTAEQIRLRIEDVVYFMVRRPKMYADTPVGFEAQFLGNVSLLLFIDEREKEYNWALTRAWQEFAHERVGHTGPKPVALSLVDAGKLGDDWQGLTTLLTDFAKSLLVPVSA